LTITPLESVAFLFIAANVWLAAKENIWCWPTGIVGVALYFVVNYQAGFYANAGLQVVYLILSIHGWYEWLHGGVNKTELHVSRTTRREWQWCMAAGIVLTGVLMVVLRLVEGAAQPFWDASTTAFSLVAQWMLNKKLVENWILWIVVDVIYVPLYFYRSLPLTAILYIGLTVLALKGYLDWKRSLASA
jgi:nicotinamide mononucleotide transporter